MRYMIFPQVKPYLTSVVIVNKSGTNPYTTVRGSITHKIISKLRVPMLMEETLHNLLDGPKPLQIVG